VENKLERNIPILYVFGFFWMSMVVIPVIVPFFATKGLSLSQVHYLQAIFAFVVVVCELPSGYFADVIGRKNALVAGGVFHALGFTWLNFASDFMDLVLFETLVGIGMSLLSGADLSLLYDSQIALGQSTDRKTRGIANMRFVKSIAEGIAALLGGFLIAYSFDAVLFANAVFGWVPLILSVFLTEAPFVAMQGNQHVGNFKKIIRHMYVDDRLLRLICLNITFFGLATFYVVWMLQPYWQHQGVALTAFGLLWAAQSFVVAFATRVAVPCERRFGPIPMLVLMGLLPIVGYIGMAGFGGVLGIALSFSFFFSRGLNQVILTDALNSRIPSSFRATANSITSFMFRGVYIVTGSLIGLLIAFFGMHTALAVLGVVVGLFFTFLLIPLLGEIRVQMGGESAGKEPSAG
jgi:MFS family permease